MLELVIDLWVFAGVVLFEPLEQGLYCHADEDAAPPDVAAGLDLLDGGDSTINYGDLVGAPVVGLEDVVADANVNDAPHLPPPFGLMTFTTLSSIPSGTSTTSMPVFFTMACRSSLEVPIS